MRISGASTAIEGDSGRICYTVEWCEAGEKLARTCLKLLRENFE